jgi:hypothetical protein
MGKRGITYLNDVQFEHHDYSATDLVLETMHLEAVALEDNLGARLAGNALENPRHARRIESSNRHEDVKVDRQEPKRRHIKLASLGK